MLAAIRPDEVNLPLLLHVLGAALLVGAVVVVAWALFGALRSRDGAATAALARFGYRTTLLGVLPAYVLMRVAAQWVYAEQDLDDLPTDPDWVGIGFIVSDLGLLLVIVTAVTTGISAKRLRERPGSSLTLTRVSAGLTAVLLVLYIVAVWAMSTKPG